MAKWEPVVSPVHRAIDLINKMDGRPAQQLPQIEVVEELRQLRDEIKSGKRKTKKNQRVAVLTSAIFEIEQLTAARRPLYKIIDERAREVEILERTVVELTQRLERRYE